MTGVKTAMPAKFGSDTVLSRMSPPTLQEKQTRGVKTGSCCVVVKQYEQIIRSKKAIVTYVTKI